MLGSLLRGLLLDLGGLQRLDLLRLGLLRRSLLGKWRLLLLNRVWRRALRPVHLLMVGVRLRVTRRRLLLLGVHIRVDVRRTSWWIHRWVRPRWRGIVRRSGSRECIITWLIVDGGIPAKRLGRR